MSDEIGYLAEEIFKQKVEEVACFLPNAFGKMQEEKDELRKELLSKIKSQRKDLENSQPVYIAKKEESVF